MATEAPSNPPLLNPVLRLTKEPVPEDPAVGGQGEAGVVQGRLLRQRRVLGDQLQHIASRTNLPSHGQRVHLIASMFADSLAPSWTPRGLFDGRVGAKLVGAISGGYVVEVEEHKLEELADYARRGNSIEARTAISRVESIYVVETRYVLRNRSVAEVWSAADDIEGGKAFVLWLAPFRSDQAQVSVAETLLRFESDETALPTFSSVSMPSPVNRDSEVGLQSVDSADQTSLGRAVRRYRASGAARAYVRLPSEQSLSKIAASGAVFRIDPARKIEVTAPAIGDEPAPPLPQLTTQPTVAVIDGGLTARSYVTFELWRAPIDSPTIHMAIEWRRLSSMRTR